METFIALESLHQAFLIESNEKKLNAKQINTPQPNPPPKLTQLWAPYVFTGDSKHINTILADLNSLNKINKAFTK